MKILITTDLFTTNTNGVVTSVTNLCDELVAKGHDVKILTLSDTMKSRHEGNVYYIRSIPTRIYPDTRMPTSFRHKYLRELIEWHPDVIHSQCEFFTFFFASHISKATGAPIVHTNHTLYEQYAAYIIPSKRIGRFVVRVFSRRRLRNVDSIIAPTHKVEDALCSYGLHNDMSVIPSGISLEQHKLRLSPEERLSMRRSLGIADDKLVLINLGRLGIEKNLDEMLSMFAKAKKVYDQLVFLIVGDGPARDELEKRTDELGISDSVIFTGMVPPSRVQYYYQLGDVFVSASTSETQGLTYVEAAANGLPLLCREDPCLVDVIEDGKNGFEWTCEQEFMTEIGEIVRDPEWRAVAGRYSERIANAFDKENFGDAVEKIYYSVVSAHG